jgi:hypothetical protein
MFSAETESVGKSTRRKMYHTLRLRPVFYTAGLVIFSASQLSAAGR